MADLRTLQRRFYELVTATGGVEAGLRRLALEPAALDEMIRARGTMSAVERLAVYARMYACRLRDALRDDYPSVRAVVGDEEFSALVAGYLSAHPPSHASLRNAGAALPSYLEAHAPDREWLADLARLERARVDVFDAADERTMTMDELRGLPSEAFAALPIRLIAAHAVVSSRFAVEGMWQTDAIAPPRQKETTLLVWREDTGVYHRAVDDDERALLPLLRAGTAFGLLCDRLSDEASVELATSRAAALLARWATDSLLAR